MAPATESQKDEIIKYLLLVMKHADFKPDYHKVAQEAGISNANTAQKRFKKFVELGGFGLVGGAVVEPGGSAAPATPVKPKAQSKKPAATPTPTKKRKMKAATPNGEEEEDGDVKQEVGSEQEE